METQHPKNIDTISYFEWIKKYPTAEQFFQIVLNHSTEINFPNIEVVKSACEFAIRKGLIHPDNIRQGTEQMQYFLEQLSHLTKGINFYKSNALRYIYEGEKLKECLCQILANGKFWIEKFGIEFFARNHDYSKARAEFMKSSIDDEFYLSCKGGSGIGTFSLDFAIGIEKGQKAMPTKEIWRMGIDTQETKDRTSLRIIRTGGALKKTHVDYEKKYNKSNVFKKLYGISPPRALAFIAMYIGKDLPVNEI